MGDAYFCVSICVLFLLIKTFKKDYETYDNAIRNKYVNKLYFS